MLFWLSFSGLFLMDDWVVFWCIAGVESEPLFGFFVYLFKWVVFVVSRFLMLGAG